MNEVVAPDSWLGEVLQRPTWRLTSPTGDVATTVRRLRDESSHGFVYGRVGSMDTKTLNALEAIGFRVVDVNVTFEISLLDLASPRDDGSVRWARGEDEAVVSSLATGCFKWSRFHLDPQIERSLADNSRGAWVNNFFQGRRGTGMAVAEVGGAVVGFLLLLGPNAGTQTIDLIGVAEAARRRGLASELARWAAHRTPGVERVRVGTQVANVASLRLYEKVGFRVVNTQYVVHLHFGGA